MKELLGGKGANLAEMTNLGIPVPGLYNHYGDLLFFSQNNDYPDGFAQQLDKNLKLLEIKMGKNLVTQKILYLCRCAAARPPPCQG